MGKLVAYSGFSSTNYLEMPYNPDLDFGTGDFCVMGWVKESSNPTDEKIIERDSATTAQRFTVAISGAGALAFTCDDNTTTRQAFSSAVLDNGSWSHFVCVYDGAGGLQVYINGTLNGSASGAALLTLNNANAILRVGLGVSGSNQLASGSLALLRVSSTAPTADQIAKIYNDEKVLFQDNAQATLYGASDAVTALAHDPVTNILSVGTSAGRSDFQGLRRVSNTETAVTTAISASNGLIVEE